METKNSVALVMGVTGMAGLAIAEALHKPSAMGAPWTVYGAARRPQPSWFPDSIVDLYIAFDASDSEDTRRKLSSISGQVTHLFWVAWQFCPTEQANIAVNSAMLSNVLNALTSESSASLALRHVTLQTGTKHYMGPIFDPVYGAQNQTPILSQEPPFREDAPRLPCPNFYYALEDVLFSYSPAITWSVHRASLIFGASSRSIFNTVLWLSGYAAICRYDGLPFKFPGSQYAWDHFCDASDARVLAEQHIWAATTERAKNQAFNCTNGDVFTWKSAWKAFCEIFGLEFLPFVPMDNKELKEWGEVMKGKSHVWDAIVEKHGLCKTDYSVVDFYDAAAGFFSIRFQHVCCVNKSRDFGFFGYADTLRSIREWVHKLGEMKIIPQV